MGRRARNGSMGRLRRWASGHRVALITGGAIGLAVMVFVLVWFQPQKLLFDDTVDEAFPIASPATVPPSAPPGTIGPEPSAPPTTVPASGGDDAASAPTTATAPTTTAPPGPRLLTEGEFIDVGHAGEGRAAIYRLPGGDLVLRLEDLDVSNGPDLRVILSSSPLVADRDAYDDGDFLDLGELKGNIGDQNYEIADDVDLARYSSVAIWCRRFNYTFNAAPLTAVDP